eukprot:scaffold50841_cov82-Phaeocystis_antarctica.AAC.2
MHPACSPAQTQRAQMFSFLSCEGKALQSLLIKAQHGRAVNSTAVKETKKKKREREKEREKETEQNRDKGKDGE